MAKLTQNYSVLGQAPLDAKLIFKNKQAFLDYINSNQYYAFDFYKGMIIYFQEEENFFIWELSFSPFYKENNKVLEQDYIYPDGTVYENLDYSNKAYNLMELPLKKIDLGKWNLNTEEQEPTLIIEVNENTISNVFVPEQITNIWPQAEKISFVDGNITGIKFQGKQINYFQEFLLLDWDQLNYDVWNIDEEYVQNSKIRVVMIGENIDYSIYENRVLANSFYEVKIIHDDVEAKNKNSFYLKSEGNSFDILVVDKYFVVKKLSDNFSKKDASNVSQNAVDWRIALNLYSKTETYSTSQVDDKISNLQSTLADKADLVDGKVLKSQSQPSTMVMNNSTYVITFTDATGVVQTIDLPLESLFKDANYDEQTKSLIITLDNGTTKSIPLTNLVDLPEIVLSATNPAVTPTSGQKVYFNTSSSQIWFNVNNQWIAGNSSLAETTSAVTSTTTVGAINAGDIIPSGTNIQELTELLLNKTFYPTFVNPTFGLTNNAGLREVGSSFNVTLTFNFDRGKILGKLDNGIWNPTMLQDYRAGTAISYLLNNVSGANNSASFNVTTNLGTNTLNGSVTYAEGVKPKDSKNNDYDSPLSSGTSPVQSTTFKGIYPYFYYKSTSPITPEIMQSAIANGQATKVIEDSTGTITIPFLPNGEYIAVAYPATSATKTKWYINALDNGDIPGGILGATNTLPCTSPTGLWNNVNFKIHVSAGVLTQYEAVQLKNS